MTTQDLLTVAALAPIACLACVMAIDFVSGLVDVLRGVYKPQEGAPTPNVPDCAFEQVAPATAPLPRESGDVCVMSPTAPAVAPAVEDESHDRASQDEGTHDRASDTHAPQQGAPAPADDLTTRLLLDEPLTVEQVRELARVNMLKGWQFYKSQTTLKRKLYPDLC